MGCQQYCQKHYSEYLNRSAATRGVDVSWRQPLQRSNNQAVLALEAVQLVNIMFRSIPCKMEF